MKVALCTTIIEGYGQTESTGASFFTHEWDGTSGHVGGPNIGTEFKLVDVPDQNYTC